MPGEISQELLSIILSELPDDTAKATKSPDIIYSKLLRYEKKLAEELLVYRKAVDLTVPAGADSEISFTVGTSPTYKIYKVFAIINKDDVLHRFCKIDSLQRKIIFSDCEAQGTYTVKLYCAVGLLSDHTIDSTHDPEIPSEYHYLLADYVISDYAPAIKKMLGYYSGKSKPEIDAEVFRKSEVLWSADLMDSTLSLNTMDF